MASVSRPSRGREKGAWNGNRLLLSGLSFWSCVFLVLPFPRIDLFQAGTTRQKRNESSLCASKGAVFGLSWRSGIFALTPSLLSAIVYEVGLVLPKGYTFCCCYLTRRLLGLLLARVPVICFPCLLVGFFCVCCCLCSVFFVVTVVAISFLAFAPEKSEKGKWATTY